MTKSEKARLDILGLKKAIRTTELKNNRRLRKALWGRKPLTESEEHVEFWGEGADLYWQQALENCDRKDTLGVKIAIRNYTRCLYNASHPTAPELNMFNSGNMIPYTLMVKRVNASLLQRAASPNVSHMQTLVLVEMSER